MARGQVKLASQANCKGGERLILCNKAEMLLWLNAEYAPEPVRELEALLRSHQVIAWNFEDSSRALQDNVPMATCRVTSLRAYRHRNRLRVNSRLKDHRRVCHPRLMSPVMPVESEAML